ncbi:MAG: hypothetical protein ACYC3I_07400 [Gemmataceae bacterium]
MLAAPSSPPSRRWIGYFVVLAVLGVTAIVVPFVYNLSIQLKPEQLAEARQRWRDRTPSNYDLEYLITTQHGEEKEDRAVLVQVREDRTVVVVDSGEIVYLDPALAVAAGSGVLTLSLESPSHYGVLALFEQMEAALRQDEKSGRRHFTTARFDPTDGHPSHFRRSFGGTKEGIEWTVKMTRFPPTPPR